MNRYPSPRTPSTPLSPISDWEFARMSSATPTPSPRPTWFEGAGSTPRRPATRAAHTRVNSYSTQSTFSPRPPRDSPRYNSSGEYATVDDVSYYDTPHGRDSAYESPRQPTSRPPTSLSHTRRASTAVPQRPSTVRPSAPGATRPAVVKPPVVPKATEEDAARHKIPAGYSLKNWDPREPPILLLGSVFDANSLGKWIYDWTVFSVGSREPLAEMAGELWLLLLELSEKMDRGERIVGKIRSKEKKAIVEDFLDGGERIMLKFRTLLKCCESPMLKATKKKSSKNPGTEFVDTLFGRDRELLKTEKWMAQVRTWSHRFEANCTSILANPTL